MSRQDLRKAKQQERSKVIHERRLIEQLRRIFRQQNIDFLDLYSRMGVPLDAAGSEEELLRTLDHHYKVVSADFKNRILDDVNDVLRKEDVEPIESNRNEVAAALALFIRREVNASVQQITDTSNRHIQQALEEHGNNAEAAYEELQGRTLARAKTIASTETQKAAEGAKQYVAESAAGVVAVITAGTNILKTWKTWQILDDRARPWHAAANGQRVLVTDPFVVGGELLMYPGDWSLGASPGNVINCRCSAIQTFSLL